MELKPENVGANYKTLKYHLRKNYKIVNFVVEIFPYRVVLYVLTIMRIEEMNYKGKK